MIKFNPNETPEIAMIYSHCWNRYSKVLFEDGSWGIMNPKEKIIFISKRKWIVDEAMTWIKFLP